MYGKREYVVFALAAVLLIAAIAGSLAIADGRKAQSEKAKVANDTATAAPAPTAQTNPFAHQTSAPFAISHTRTS